MSKKTSYLLGILLTIILGTLLYYYFCCKPCLEAANTEVEVENVVKPEVKIATKNAFSAIDSKSNLRFSANDNFNFKASDFSILDSVSGKLQSETDRLSGYLKDNPEKEIDITGYYTSAEENNSAFPNLGFARANVVKNFFVSKGIASKQINTNGTLNDALISDENDIYYGPLTYNVSTRDKDDTIGMETLKAKCDAIKDNPLVLHFKTGEAHINLTVEQRQKIADISRCIDKMGAKVKIVGHTDNTGDAANNLVLGQGRADFAKKYLISNGILTGNIETASKGQTKPIADNATEDGKAKNRRTEVTLN